VSLDAACSTRITGQVSGLYVCHACDALQNIAAVKPGAVATCVCCGSTLLRNPNGGGERPLALLIAAAILFFISNIYPIMDIKIAGIEQSTTLTGAAMIFVELDNHLLAAAVWVPGVLIPGIVIFGLLYVMGSIQFNLGFPYTKNILVLVSRLTPFGMMDVFLLGVLVALVKLVALADVILGPGFYALMSLIIVYAATMSSLELHLLWDSLDEKPSSSLE